MNRYPKYTSNKSTANCNDCKGCVLPTQPPVINNATNSSERSLLLTTQFQNYQENYNTTVVNALQYTATNNTAITNALFDQLLEIRMNRYAPYQPYIPPVIPPSEIMLEMNTVNVGVPHSFFTDKDCKGVQSVTTSNVIIN